MKRTYMNLFFWTRIFFFFNDTATTEIYTLSLHDALPISFWHSRLEVGSSSPNPEGGYSWSARSSAITSARSEEHTSELQSRPHLVCRLLLEKKKTRVTRMSPT